MTPAPDPLDMAVAKLERDLNSGGEHLVTTTKADLRALLSAFKAQGEALEPFVAYARHIDDGVTFSDDSEIVSVLSGGLRRSIRFRDLRRARALSPTVKG